MLLATAQLWVIMFLACMADMLTSFRRSFQIFGSDAKAQFTNTSRALDWQSSSLRVIQERLEENKQLISKGNGLLTKFANRIDWVKGLAAEFKHYMHQIVAGNLAIYREVLATRSSFTLQVDRPLCEDPFILEDAIGRIAPVHLRFITSWEAFDSVMEILFKGSRACHRSRKRNTFFERWQPKWRLAEPLNFQIYSSRDRKSRWRSSSKIGQQMWRRDLGLSVPTARSHRKSSEMLTYCGKHFRESVLKYHLLTDGFSKNCSMWSRRVQGV